MVLFTMTITPRMSDRMGLWALVLIPISAVLGLFVGWQVMWLLFTLIGS